MADLTGTQHPPAGETALLPAREVTRRYGVVDRTLGRWLENVDLGFPRPLVINKRRYFRLTDLERWERERARAAGAA